jgi:hypothetical protein
MRKAWLGAIRKPLTSPQASKAPAASDRPRCSHSASRAGGSAAGELALEIGAVPPAEVEAAALPPQERRVVQDDRDADAGGGVTREHTQQSQDQTGRAHRAPHVQITRTRQRSCEALAQGDRGFAAVLGFETRHGAEQRRRHPQIAAERRRVPLQRRAHVGTPLERRPQCMHDAESLHGLRLPRRIEWPGAQPDAPSQARSHAAAPPSARPARSHAVRPRRRPKAASVTAASASAMRPRRCVATQALEQRHARWRQQQHQQHAEHATRGVQTDPEAHRACRRGDVAGQESVVRLARDPPLPPPLQEQQTTAGVSGADAGDRWCSEARIVEPGRACEIDARRCADRRGDPAEPGFARASRRRPAARREKASARRHRRRSRLPRGR